MKVTRHNYEEWFILYLDNELDSADRSEVELFVKENPDLQPEFDLLLQSQLTVDTSLVFPGRHTLLKATGPSISLGNYEEWLLLYTDGELNPEEKKSVEQFIEAHPLVKSELELLQKTKLQPETIVFADKQSLYRREEKVRVLAFSWRRIAIAASLILAVGTTAWIISNSGNEPAPAVADNGKKITTPVQQNENEVINREAPTESQLATNATAPVNEKTENDAAVATTEAKKDVILPAERIVPIKTQKDDALVIAPKQEVRSNELPKPESNPNVIRQPLEENPIAMTESPAHDPLTISKETNLNTTVTPGNSNALYIVNTSTEPIQQVDDSQPGKKNRLRGFFRKVTRTFEKTTNIKATDDEDRLLVGGLAIKL